MSLDWRKHRDKGGQASLASGSVSQEWEEGYDVIDYVPPAGTPAWVGLIIDRPWLAPGSIHPTILSAFVARFGAEPIDTTRGWRVTVRYRVGDPQSRDLPPAMRPAVIETSTESLDVPTFRKADGSAWVNTAGDLLAGLSKKKTRIIFNVRKNVTAVPAWSLTYADAVNSDSVNIRGLVIAAGHLLLGDLRVGNITPEQVNGVMYLYLPVSFTLTYDPDTWITRAYNRGLYQIDGNGKYVPCADDDGEPVQEPAFLDSGGTQLPYPVDPSSIVILEGWDHDLLPFSALPLT